MLIFTKNQKLSFQHWESFRLGEMFCFVLFFYIPEMRHMMVGVRYLLFTLSFC